MTKEAKPNPIRKAVSPVSPYLVSRAHYVITQAQVGVTNGTLVALLPVGQEPSHSG